MSEQQELSKRSHLWTWVAVVVALLPVLYVLSIGPAFGLWRRNDPGPFEPQWYYTTYRPLENLAIAAHCDDWLNNYKGWWLERIIIWTSPPP